jgi:Domain of unknown function (DUF222)
VFEAVLADLERAVDAVVVGCDPERITASCALELVGRVDRLERRLGGLKMILAGRVAESQVWKHRGDRSAAHWLAGQAGTTVGDAVDVLETAHRLKALPVTAEAVRDGRLSKAQACAVADAATVAPDAEVALIGLAGRESVKGLRDEAARRKQAHLDENTRYEAIRASRHVRFGTEADGAATMGVRTTPDAMAEIKAAIAHHQTKIFDTARRQGLRDPFEAYAADALLDMARTSLGRSRSGLATGTHQPDGSDEPGPRPKRVPTKVIVRVDHSALARGWVEPGEVCDIPGVGPIPVTQVRQSLEAGDSFCAVIVTEHDQVTTVAHHGHKPVTHPATLVDVVVERGHDVTGAHHSRAPDTYQRTALDWTNASCAVEGCDLPRQQIDHRVDWARTHHTKLDELDGYCAHHHALKTRRNYQLAPGTGRRPMLPPAGAGPP